MAKTEARNLFWLWAHEAGTHNGVGGIPGTSRITPVEAAAYLGIPNVILVRVDDRPRPPYTQYAVPFQSLREVVWSIVGASGQTHADEVGSVLSLAADLPPLSGAMMDDFFRPGEDEDVGVHSVSQLRQVRERLRGGPRPLDLWVVLYDYQLGLPVRRHLECCEVVTFWTWKAEGLERLEENLETFVELAAGRRRVLGCYLFDYGNGRPMSVELMRRQCEIGLEWMRRGRIHGMIFLASCICDLPLDSVAWTRRWIAANGSRRVPAPPDVSR
jgi:hypothetical protein